MKVWALCFVDYNEEHALLCGNRTFNGELDFESTFQYVLFDEAEFDSTLGHWVKASSIYRKIEVEI